MHVLSVLNTTCIKKNKTINRTREWMLDRTEFGKRFFSTPQNYYHRPCNNAVDEIVD